MRCPSRWLLRSCAAFVRQVVELWRGVCAAWRRLRLAALANGTSKSSTSRYSSFLVFHHVRGQTLHNSRILVFVFITVILIFYRLCSSCHHAYRPVFFVRAQRYPKSATIIPKCEAKPQSFHLDRHLDLLPLMSSHLISYYLICSSSHNVCFAERILEHCAMTVFLFTFQSSRLAKQQPSSQIGWKPSIAFDTSSRGKSASRKRIKTVSLLASGPHRSAVCFL